MRDQVNIFFHACCIEAVVIKSNSKPLINGHVYVLIIFAL